VNGLLTPQRSAGTIIELSFRLLGRAIPVDHGYALYAALSRVVPELHDAQELGIQPVRGVYAGGGVLHLAPFSCLAIRLPQDQIQPVLKLTGKTADVDGHVLHIGMPNARALLPVANLRARLVTIKGFLEAESFTEAAKRQLQSLDIAGEFLLGIRRTLRVKDKQVVGFEVGVTELTAEESLILQERGLGGRRRMGCGVFVPWRG
jgi:CRISPR-associated protein Cas6